MKGGTVKNLTWAFENLSSLTALLHLTILANLFLSLAYKYADFATMFCPALMGAVWAVRLHNVPPWSQGCKRLRCSCVHLILDIALLGVCLLYLRTKLCRLYAHLHAFEDFAY